MPNRMAGSAPIRRMLALWILSGSIGCGRIPGPWIAPGSRDSVEVRIATPWNAADRSEAERKLRAAGADLASIRIAWIELPSGFPFDRASVRVPAIHMYLGGPRWEYERLAAAGQLGGAGGEADPAPRVVRRLAIVAGGKGTDAGPSGRPILEDPRVDPVTLTWAEGRLTQQGWLEGYASVLLDYGNAARSAGWQAGTASAAEDRPGTAPVWTLQLASPSEMASSDIVYEEWGAVGSHAADPAACKRILDVLAGPASIEGRRAQTVDDARRSELLADLLGSTLVDAQEELREACEILGRAPANAGAGSPARAWLLEPPPWPPAFVKKLQERGGDHALAMVQDLAARVAPDPEARFWLVQSWLRPTRPIDGSFLAELAGAAGGRLARQADFREWLRREWTAWARQRYRRVARVASGRLPQPG
ncbi:hypothetical protein [Aquisphaera insulae]|uniref:hypothetical protein n=1 Tax=Aquisphaera insulae TaxID=2712864 RepID=UPI0013EBD3CF|nr:hypothetical protein [Aquisphaera insulae]